MVAYLAVIQGVGRVIAALLDTVHGTIPDSASFLAKTVPPAVAGIGAIVLVIRRTDTARVLAPRPRLHPWVWVVPIGLVATSVSVVDVTNLSDNGSSLVVSLIIFSLVVGIGEEFMFRGYVVQTLESMGASPGRVAIAVSVIFGAAHLSNAVHSGTAAIAQAMIVTFVGACLYLTYRVSGTLIVPIVVHAFWDFAVFSDELGTDAKVDPVNRALPVIVPIALVLLAMVFRHRLGLTASEPTPATREAIASEHHRR